MVEKQVVERYMVEKNIGREVPPDELEVGDYVEIPTYLTSDPHGMRGMLAEIVGIEEDVASVKALKDGRVKEGRYQLSGLNLVKKGD